MKETILLVDDDKDLVRVLRLSLEKRGYRVLSAGGSREALALIRRSAPDLVVLDVVMPGMDGLELLRVLRQESDVPVIFLSGQSDEVHRILGLKLGADDYVAKPFSIEELLARVSARLRRGAPPAAAPRAAAGGLVVDFERHEVRAGGRPVRLAPKEFKLLELLIRADGKVLSRQRLLTLIWGHDEDVEIDTRTVDQHVARLRRKLGAQGRLVETVPALGYKFAR